MSHSDHGLSRGILVFMVVLHVVPFAVRPALIGGDEPHYALAAMSLAVDGDLRLEQDYWAVARGDSKAAGARIAGKDLDRHVRSYGDREVFSHPVGLPLLLAPLLWLQQCVSPGAGPDILIALVTLSVTFFALLAGRDLLFKAVGHRMDADFLTFGLYFSTPLWFYSRTLFTEPYLWSFFVIALWCMARNRWTLASLPLGFTFLLKETAALVIVPLLIAVFLRKGPRTGLTIAVFPAFVFAGFVAKNVMLYGKPIVTFQPFQYGDLLTGGIGVLFDPAHGLLVFAPLVLILLGCRWWALRSDVVMAVVVLVSWFLLTASWVDWRGGSCYGPRLLLPVLPALAVLVLQTWFHCSSDGRFRILVQTLVVVGFTIQFCAAVGPFRAFWSIPIDELLLADPVMSVVGVAVGTWLVRRFRPSNPAEV